MDLLKKLRRRSIHAAYSRNLAGLNVSDDAQILDIGSGPLIIRQIFKGSNIKYTAFDPILSDSKFRANKYGDRLIADYFSPDYVRGEIFSHIFMLTVLDEIYNKENFLESVSELMSSDTTLVIAVRNLSFPFRLNTRVRQKVDGALISDLKYDEWVRLFKHYDVLSIEKFSRPIFSIRISVTIKQLATRILDYFLPVKSSYMIKFVMKKKEI